MASSQAFAQFGDYSSYALVTGATFESYSGWSLSGASIVDGNEPFYIHSAGDDQSLLLRPGSRASAPSMCLGLDDPTVRFIANGPSGGSLQIDLNVRTVLGLNLTLPVGRLAGNGTWGPSPVYSIQLHNILSMLQLFGQPKATFHFTSVSGNWQIDDAYVDPWTSACC